MDILNDPVELLRAANPVDERDLCDVPDSRFARSLFRRITGTAYRREGRSLARRPRLQVYVAGLIGVVATGAGVSYAVMSHRPSSRAGVGCYADVSLSASAAVVSDAGADPVSACRSAWALGHIPGRSAVTGQALTACLLPSGVAGVFPDPAGTACLRLRLPTIDLPLRTDSSATTVGPSAGSGGSVAPTPTLGDSVSGMISTVVSGLSNGCLNGDQARLLIRGALDQAGLAGWKVTEAAPFTAVRRCASPAFDEIKHVVMIVPIPAIPGQAGGA